MTQQHDNNAYAGSMPENYQRYFVPAIGAPAANGLIKMAALRPGERVLDVACGTGIVARLASEAVGAAGTVSGIDINPAMLAVARSATPPGMVIDWGEANVEALPHAEASFNAVLCQMGLQFVPDKSTALGEMQRVLVPGGRLILNLPGPTPQLFVIMQEALARQVGADAAGFVPQVFCLHDTDAIHKLISDAGFRDVTVAANTRSLPLPAPKDFLWQYVHSTPLAGAVAQLDAGQRDALEHEVVAKWQEFVTDDALMLEVRMVLATARK